MRHSVHSARIRAQTFDYEAVMKIRRVNARAHVLNANLRHSRAINSCGSNIVPLCAARFAASGARQRHQPSIAAFAKAVAPSRLRARDAHVLRSLRFCRGRPAETVGPGCSLRRQPDDQDDRADQRNEREKKPPSGTVGVVQPAHADSNAGKNRRQRKQRTQDRRADHRVVDDLQHDGNDDDRREPRTNIPNAARGR